MRLDTLAGIGIAGIIAGAVTSAWVHGPQSSEIAEDRGDGRGDATQNTEDEAQSSAQLKAAREATLHAFLAAHKRLHPQDNTQNQPTSADTVSGLTARIEADDWMGELRKELHLYTAGPVFVAPDGVTPLSVSVLREIAALDSHGLALKAYDLKALNALAARMDTGSNEGEISAAKRLLMRDELDRERVLRFLEHAQSLPKPEEIERLARRLEETPKQPSLSADALDFEVAMMGALVRLIIDHRFRKVAGPFNLTTTAARSVAKKKERARFLATAHRVLESDQPGEILASLAGRHPQYEAMRTAFERYRDIVSGGGCRTLPRGWRIRPEMQGDEVRRLQERMTCEGLYDGPHDGNYGDALLTSIRRYQRNHELEDDGLVYEGTIKSMNVPMARRLEKITLALQRLRESRINTLDADFFIRVNLPSFHLQVWEDGVVTRRHKTIVGTNRLDDDKVALIQGHINRTDLFLTDLYRVVINPNWILPRRIEKGEVEGKIAEDPDYLEKHNIQRTTLDDGREVLIQGAGPDNALGKVKFLLRDSRAIYLHDTDKRWLFREARRDFSHGCIRVDQAVKFAHWLLDHDGWDAKDVKQAMKMETTQRGMTLTKPVPLVTEYVTVDISAEGDPIFLTDIYKFDKAYEKGTLPPEVKTLWGSPNLRPGWVPRVARKIVESWRAEGQPAPRDYDPNKPPTTE